MFESVHMRRESKLLRAWKKKQIGTELFVVVSGGGVGTKPLDSKSTAGDFDITEILCGLPSCNRCSEAQIEEECCLEAVYDTEQRESTIEMCCQRLSTKFIMVFTSVAETMTTKMALDTMVL